MDMHKRMKQQYICTANHIHSYESNNFLFHFFTYIVHEREYTREAKKKEGEKIERKPAMS